MPVLSLVVSTESLGITCPCLASVLPEVMVGVVWTAFFVSDVPLLHAHNEAAVIKTNIIFFIELCFIKSKQELCNFNFVMD